MINPSANPLARHYSRFRVAERLLLTGHSHQAWPDVGFEAQQRAWLDAAELVDDKWTRAEEQASRVRAGFRRLLGDTDPDADIALGQNTHELVTRLLSALLPIFGGRRSGTESETGSGRDGQRARLLTTDGEFHTIRRQLDRLEEAGIEVTRIAARPADSVAERMAAALDSPTRTACVLISSVFFETAEIVPHLATLAAACRHHGVTLLVDAYHHLNVVPFDLHGMDLGDAFVTGGGYKYCQLGEGNAFLRVPPHCSLRPVLTGWFSEFAALDTRHGTGDGERARVRYGAGAARFAGATYDPTSHYRAAAVFDFHAQLDLTPTRLREISQHQTALLQSAFDALDVDPAIAQVEPMPHERRAGFLALRSPRARQLSEALRARGMLTDSRGAWLRLGPAPYLSDTQLRDAIALLGEAIHQLT